MIPDFQFLPTFGGINILSSAGGLLLLIIIPIVLIALFKDFWLYWRQSLWRSRQIYITLEIHIPREITTGPKAMEQFFSAVYSLKNSPGDILEKWWDGETTRYFSYEIVAEAGRLRFFMKIPKKFQAAVESMLYGQYADIEITEASDYVDSVPSTVEGIHSLDLEVWGNEVLLVKPAPYPIVTYQIFEQIAGDERIIDPVSVIHEIASKLNENEKIWIQIVTQGADGSWVKEGIKIIEGIKKKLRPEPKPGQAVVFGMMTAMEEGEIKEISRKISKPGFRTIIRYLYIAPKQGFNPDFPEKGVFSYFGQYRSESLNSFRANPKVRTKLWWRNFPFVFPNRRLEGRRRSVLQHYRERFTPEETALGKFEETGDLIGSGTSQASILNAEELATLYHMPTNVVLTAQVIDRMESKKLSPPSYLPVK